MELNRSEDEAFMRYMQMKEEYGTLNSYGVLNEQHRDALVYHAKELYDTHEEGLEEDEEETNNMEDIAIITAMLQGLKVFPALLQLTMSEADMMDIIVEHYNEA